LLLGQRGKINNRLDRGLLRINIVRDLLASAQNHNTINHLKYVVNIVGDKDARMPRVAGTTDETQYAFGLVDTKIVGGLIEDNQVAVEMHSAGYCDCLPFAARQCTNRGGWRNFFRDTDLLEQPARHLIHCVLIQPIKEAWLFHWFTSEKQIASDRELGHQRRVLVDRLDPLGDGIGRIADVDLAATYVDIPAVGPECTRENLDQR
jgi:hypothetical protein